MAKPVPPPLKDAADSLFQHTLTLLDDVPPGGMAAWSAFTEATAGDDAVLDATLVRSYLEAVSDENRWRGFWEAALFLSSAIGDFFGVAAPPRAGGPIRTASSKRHGAAFHSPRVTPQLRERLLTWQRKFSLFDAMWMAWAESVSRAVKQAATARPPVPTSEANPPAILSGDEQAAIDQLLTAATARAEATEAVLPSRLLRRWSVPVLVGPAGAGKAFVCEEFARRRGWAYRRWQVGSWLIQANRTGNTTFEQIIRHIEDNRGGCVIYLSGLDTLASSIRGGDQNASYMNAVVGELEYLLDLLTARFLPPMTSKTGESFVPELMIVVSGRFPGLWGEVEVGTPGGADGWKIADDEPLSGPSAVAAWLSDHSGLPAGIVRRLTAEPLLLPRIAADEAKRIARSIHADLPPSLDGLGIEQIAAALGGPQGWRGVSALVEQSLCAGSDLPVGPDAGASSLAD